MFIDKLKQQQMQETENGALGFVTTGKALVDLNFAIPSYRNGIDKDKFDEALAEDTNLTLRWLLYLRDIREGVGERKSFRDFVIHLCSVNEGFAEDFIGKVPLEEYGRWDDLIDIAYRCRERNIIRMLLEKVKRQLVKDIRVVDSNTNKPISLLAKWLPSNVASSKETRDKAKMVMAYLDMSPKAYRKTLSKLRKYLKLVEVNASANEWDKIDYSAVPSKANLLYRDAFMRHDGDRRLEYLESLKKGKAKINAQAMFLHDIVHAYINTTYSWNLDNIVHDTDTTLEELWKAQKKVDGFQNTLVVRDGSGSMGTSVGNSSITALDVADAISIYCAENNTGEYKDKVITFSAKARLIDLSSCESLRDKIDKLRRNSDYENTNIENVFDLILRTAIKNNMSQDDMPKNVLIISDMEYDAGVSFKYNHGDNQEALFETIAKKFEDNGYVMPKLIFWNVNSRTNTIPLTQNKAGVILLSGFSKNLMSMVMSSELDPYKALVKELKKERYDVVDKVVL